MKALLNELWYQTVYTFSAGITTACFGMRMERRHGFPMNGPVLVLANHQSFLDPAVVGLAVGRPLVYLARKTLFRNRFFSGLIRSMNAVPIDQEGVGKEGIRTVLDELGQGKAVLVFPEGARTPDGRMRPLKPGVHLLIKRSRAPIVPLGIAGAYDAWPIWRKYPVPMPLIQVSAVDPIAVVVGRTLSSQRFADLPRAEALTALFEEIAKVQGRAEEIRKRRLF